VLRHMLTPRRYRDPGYAMSIAGEIYGGGMRSRPARVAGLLHADGRRGPGRGEYYQLLAGAGGTSLPLLPLLRRPTLVLAGHDDRLTPLVRGHTLHRLTAGSELVVSGGGPLALTAERARRARVIERSLRPGAPPAGRRSDEPGRALSPG